jgi:hypothetical protein
MAYNYDSKCFWMSWMPPVGDAITLREHTIHHYGQVLREVDQSRDRLLWLENEKKRLEHELPELMPKFSPVLSL